MKEGSLKYTATKFKAAEYLVNPEDSADRYLLSGINGLRALFSTADVQVPDNISSRFIVLNEPEYQRILQEESRRDVDGFVSSRTGTAFASAHKITEMSTAVGVSEEEARAQIGIHELIHTLEYEERWSPAPGNQDGNSQIRRSGIVTYRPEVPSDPSEYLLRIKGLERLNEGIVQFLAILSTRPIVSTYEGEVLMAIQVANIVGLQTLIRAITTKNGLLELVRNFEIKLGRGSFQELVKTIGTMYVENKIKNINKPEDQKTDPDYSDLIKLFELAEAEERQL